MRYQSVSLWGLLVLMGCAGSVTSTDDAGMSGTATGGAPPTTRSSSGGSSAALPSTGGAAPGSGGVAVSGGVSSVASSEATGGASVAPTTTNTGGASSAAAGGVTGAITGGAVGSGGATSMASTLASGGNTAAVGGSHAGGMASAGGTLGIGGASSSSTGGATTVNPVIFARSLPRDSMIYGNGPHIAAKPNGNVVLMGPAAPVDWFPTDSGFPFLVELNDQGAVVHKRSFPEGVLADAMTVDANGDTVLIVQLYREQTSFGGSKLAPVEKGYGLIKLDESFNPKFQIPMTTQDDVFIQSVTTSSENDIYVGLETHSTSPEWLGAPLFHKFSSTGDPQWSSHTTHSNSGAYPNALDVSSSGDLVACGSFNGTLNLGTFTLDSQAMSGSSRMYNGFYAWFASATGTPTEAQRFGGTLFDLCTGLEVTRNGDIVMLGSMSGQASFAGSTETYSVAGEPFVAKLTSGGSLTWITKLDLQSAAVFALAVAPSDTIYAGGRVTRTTSAGVTQDSTFVASVSSEGEPGHLKEYPNTANGADHVVATSTGALWFTGTAHGQVDFGSGPINYGPGPNDGTLYVVRMPAF